MKDMLNFQQSLLNYDPTGQKSMGSKVFPDGLMDDMAIKKYFKLYCVLHSSSNVNWFTQSNLSGSALEMKYPNTFLLVFFVSPQIVQNVVALTYCFQHVSHVESTFKYINTYAYVFCLSV